MLDHEKIKERLAEHDKIWNAAIEAAASRLQIDYPDHKWTNAYSAAIRNLKK